MSKKLTIHNLYEMKRNAQQVAWVTAYDFPTASFAQAAGIDMILVGDSMGMVLLGYQDTLPVTMEDCISHCRAVRRGAPNTFLIGDMPFGSYQISDEDAVKNAISFLKNGHVDCIKLEGGMRVKSRIQAIVNAGIPVMGHIGLTPQSTGQLGGFKAQGRTVDSARLLIHDALAIQEAGAFSILIEAVPAEVTSIIRDLLKIPVYSIGAGACDGQLLICGDLLGAFEAFSPKFVKKYANIAEISTNAFSQYIAEVKQGKFPSKEHLYGLAEPVECFEGLRKEFIGK